jgi:hypothetical protein
MKKLIAFVLVSVLFSCTNEADSREVLEAQGYTDIQILGYGWNKCADDDATCTSFVATGPATIGKEGQVWPGRKVHGAVGCSRTGCGKGCTVRITHVGD